MTRLLTAHLALWAFFGFGLPASAQERPGVTRTFVCTNFDPNSAELGARCQQILNEAAEYWVAHQGTLRADCPNPPVARWHGTRPDFSGPDAHIAILGHADTAEAARGSANSISAARAEAVRRFLMLLCIPEAALRSRSGGTARPMVPTGPNVSQPLNRYAEVFHR